MASLYLRAEGPTVSRRHVLLTVQWSWQAISWSLHGIKMEPCTKNQIL